MAGLLGNMLQSSAPMPKTLPKPVMQAKPLLSSPYGNLTAPVDFSKIQTENIPRSPLAAAGSAVVKSGLLNGPMERVHALQQSVQQKSMAPLNASFAAQKKEMSTPEGLLSMLPGEGGAARKIRALYRGGPEFKYDPKLDTGSTPFTTNKTVAEDFAKRSGGIVNERYLKPDAKVLDAAKIDTSDFLKEGYKNPTLDNIIEYADLKGYDAVDFTGTRKGTGWMQEVHVINPDTALLTKPDLLQINTISGFNSADHRTTHNHLKKELPRPATLKKPAAAIHTPPQTETGTPPTPPPTGSSYAGSESPGNDPVKAITEALQKAKPIRGKQEALYSAERSKRIAAVSAMGKKVPGEQGYFAQLGQLKGELPKVQFESIRKDITQPHIDSLFNMVEKSHITPFEKVSAKGGLAKLLGAEGGTVPTKSEIALLQEIFPPEFVKSILDQRPLMQKLWGGTMNALNLPRAVMATADLSAPLRQGIFLIGRPTKFGPAFGSMFKYAASDKAYQGLMEGIRARPTYHAMRDGKLALTDMGAVLNHREEQFMSNLVERIPVFGAIARGSNRAYSGFLNKLRADTFDDLYRKSQHLGLDKSVANDIAKYVNAATGRGSLGRLERAAEVLNATFFSPRLMSSRLNLLYPPFYYKLDPFVRKEALKDLFRFAGVAGTVLGLAKAGGASVGVDPRSADVAKIKIGNTRLDVMGGFQQYLVAATRLMTGQMISSTTGKETTLGQGYKPTTRLDIIQRTFENKTSPVTSFALALAKGQSALGDPINVPAEVADRFIPMIISDMYELAQDKGAADLGLALPALFGTGVQTYTDQIPTKGTTPSGKPKIDWRAAPSLGETIVNKVTGKQITNIPKAEQGPLRAKRAADIEHQIALEKAKAQVKQTGESTRIDDTYVYMEDGILKTSSGVHGKALELDAQLQKLDRAAANAKVQQVQLSDPSLYNSLKSIVEERKLNLTPEEKTMRGMGVVNGERARYVNEQIMKLPTSEERNAYLKTLQEKKIITKQVYEQLKALQ